MAATKHHVRSISLPSRSHPSTLRMEEELKKLETWEATSTSTSESICIGLSGLEHLYNSLDDDLLNLASTQQLLSTHRNDKCLDELLDGSVKLLDICSIAREFMLQFKEQVQALQSAIRRRKGDLSLEKSVITYTCLRKRINKDAKKLIVKLKQMENKFRMFTLVDKDHHFSAVIQILRDVNQMNICVFQSLLLFLSTPVSKPKQSKWSLVSKLMQKGAVACEYQTRNELENADAALTEFGNPNKRLEAMERSIEEIENCLERVFRRLIKTRSCILNIFSQ